jgi:hypothetical protein
MLEMILVLKLQTQNSIIAPPECRMVERLLHIKAAILSMI